MPTCVSKSIGSSGLSRSAFAIMCKLSQVPCQTLMNPLMCHSHSEIWIQRECPGDHICTCIEFMDKWRVPTLPNTVRPHHSGLIPLLDTQAFCFRHVAMRSRTNGWPFAMLT